LKLIWDARGCKVWRGNGRIVKINHRIRERVASEIMALERLQGLPGFPQLLDADLDAGRIEMTDVGETMRSLRCPVPDWRSQMFGLLDSLREVDITHPDVRPKNVTLLDGRLHLIDFECAREEFDLTAPICSRGESMAGRIAKTARWCRWDGAGREYRAAQVVAEYREWQRDKPSPQ
jgi:tRNA A-37 threonylcarbamoyl transferase component Bud32